MSTILTIKNKQYIVREGLILKVDFISLVKEKDVIEFNRTLACLEEDNITIGFPLLQNITVKATVLKHERGKKVIVFKKRRRKNSQTTQGFRHSYTHLRIENITKK